MDLIIRRLVQGCTKKTLNNQSLCHWINTEGKRQLKYHGLLFIYTEDVTAGHGFWSNWFNKHRHRREKWSVSFLWWCSKCHYKCNATRATTPLWAFDSRGGLHRVTGRRRLKGDMKLWRYLNSWINNPVGSKGLLVFGLLSVSFHCSKMQETSICLWWWPNFSIWNLWGNITVTPPGLTVSRGRQQNSILHVGELQRCP